MRAPDVPILEDYRNFWACGEIYSCLAFQSKATAHLFQTVLKIYRKRFQLF